MKKFLTRSILVILVTVLIFFTYNAVDIWLFSREDQATQADVAIVLGASLVWNQPSPVFAERINHAVWLYQNGYVQRIILTGGVSEGNLFSESFIAWEYTRNLGVPESAIYIEEHSENTWENISYAAEIMNERGMSTAIIVSDPFHMRRSIAIAERFDITVFSSPTPTTQFQTLETKVPFLLRETFSLGWQRINDLLQ